MNCETKTNYHRYEITLDKPFSQKTQKEDLKENPV